MSYVHSGQELLEFQNDAVYSLLAHLPPGLFVDVGAASGKSTKTMLERSPQSRVIAFEPFPGNFKFIDENVGKDPRVQIVRKAVSDTPGTRTFHISRTVSNGVGSWKGMDGYSSVGKLVDDGFTSDKGETIQVESCSLAEYVTERVRFLKIDAQGAEPEILRGSASVIDRYGIDLMYVEFSDQIEILELLDSKGYAIYDTEYMITLRRDAKVEDDWLVQRRANVSTGARVGYGWPKNTPRDFAGYCKFMAAQRKTLGHVQTDLVCVSRSINDAFFDALIKARLARS